VALARSGLLVLLLGLSAWAAHAGSRVRTARRSRTPRSSRPDRHPEDAPRVEVAFVLDTTGSMAGLIDGPKRKIWSIANQLASGQPRPVVRMALIAYATAATPTSPAVPRLTDDIDAIYAHLQQLSADGGGDTPESVNQALDDAVDAPRRGRATRTSTARSSWSATRRRTWTTPTT
jgi:Mg-chelatase subunit ChlD